ncbi:MAG TPA: F0F1 ATP synthase subunit delta [Candidatus Onthovivens sp.]|mgnify:CR=1 FL=1|nr:F0F1 ATP synthase subunit delta [Candidatus Onthovivens sp.]
MENNLFNRYAIALLDLAIEENCPHEYRSEIKVLKALIKENEEFVRVLSCVSFSLTKKYQIIEETFKSCKVGIGNFIKIIIKNNRGFFLYEILKETLFRFDDYLLIEQGTIYSTTKLEAAEIKKISAVISKNINKDVELDNKIDESLIGGFKVILKNNIYDTSIKMQLEKMKNELVKRR